MRRRVTTPLAAVGLTGLIGITAACTETTGSEGMLINDDRIVTCTHLSYEPFQFRQGDDIVGFDVDLIDLVAEDLGVEQEILDTPFEGIQSGEDLNTNRCDVGAAAMTITDVREENFDFSDPYFDVQLVLLTPDDAAVSELADLEGEVVGVQQATTGEDYANERAEELGYTTRQFEDLPLLTTALQTGDIAAALGDDWVLQRHAEENPDTEISVEFEDSNQQFGFGVREGNDELREQINSTLAQAREDGTYDELYEKWFSEE